MAHSAVAPKDDHILMLACDVHPNQNIATGMAIAPGKANISDISVGVSRYFPAHTNTYLVEPGGQCGYRP